jgi:hypothetical protein
MSAQGMPKDYGLWARRTSLSTAGAVIPLFIAIPMMMLFTGGIQIRHWLPQASPSGETTLPYLNVAGLAMLMLLLVSVVVAVAGWAGLRRALWRAEVPTTPRRLIWVPFLAVIADIVLVFPFIRVNQWSPLSGNSPLRQALAVALPIVFWLGLIASIVGVLVVANRCQLAALDLARGARIAAVSAAVFGGYLAAYCVWGGILLFETHRVAHDSYFSQSLPSKDLWILTVMALLVGLIVSICSARIARKSNGILTTAA